MAQANAWAGFLLPVAFAIAGAWCLSQGRRGWRSVASWFVLAWLGYSMGLTGSRGAFLACLGSAIFLVVIGAWLRKGRGPLAVALTLLVAYLAGGQTAVLLPTGSMGGTPVHSNYHPPKMDAGAPSDKVPASARDPRFGSLSSRLGELSSNEPVTPRLIMWSSALAMIADGPWHGVGPGVFWLAYPPYRNPSDNSAGFHVHNDYLEVAAELGYPGVLLLLLLLAGAGEAAWRAARVDSADSGEALVLFAAVLATYLHMIVDFNFHNLSLLLVLGLILARLHVLADDARPYATWSAGPLRRSLLVAGLATVLWLGIAAVYVRQGLAAHRLEQADRALALGQTRAADDWLERAVRADAASEIALIARADLYRQLLLAQQSAAPADRAALAQQGIALALQAREINPLRAETYLFEGDFQAQLIATGGLPALERSSAAYRQALQRDPRLLPARIGLLQLLQARGDGSGAAAVAEAGLAEFYPPSERADWQRYMLLAIRQRAMQGNLAGAEELAKLVDAQLVSGGGRAMVLDELRSVFPAH
jgi:hypothetical protein